LVRRLNEGNGGVPAGGKLLDISGIVADTIQTESAEKGIAFVDDQDVVSAGEKRNAFFGMGTPGVAEEFGGNLDRGRRGSGPRPNEFRSLRFRLFDGRRGGRKNVAVRTGILGFADSLQKIHMEIGFLDVERLEFGIGSEDAGKSRDVAPTREIVVTRVGNQNHEGRENIKFSAP